MTLRQAVRSWYMFFFQLPWVPEWKIRRKNFAVLEQMFKDTVGRPGSFSDTDIEAYKEALRQPGAVTAAVNYYRANVRRIMSRSGRTDTEPGEARNSGKTATGLKAPTLFIFGERDVAILPETVRGVGEYIDAPFTEVRIPDSGHWVQNEAAEEVNAALLEFLANGKTKPK